MGTVRELLILGTGPHSLEMAEMVARVNGVQPTWELLGFVSASSRERGQCRLGRPVLGGPEVWDEHREAALLPEFGWPREACPPRDRLVSLVDPGAVVSRTAQVGLGCVIYPHCFVGANARLGDFVFCLSSSTINHDDVIEDRVSLASGVLLAGEVHVEAECYLGQGCLVRQKLTIGRGSTIGMGAVVIADVEPDSVMVGNPARRLRSAGGRP
jgi:sugar O-acyltransferase (sialic acid O-acetyltransferase NeuD family)